MLSCLEHLSNGEMTDRLHGELKNSWPISELIDDKIIKLRADSDQEVNEAFYKRYFNTYDAHNESASFLSFFNNRQVMPFEKPSGDGKEQFRYVGNKKISFLEEDKIAVCYTTKVLGEIPIVFWIAFSILKRKRSNALQVHIEGKTTQENLLRWQFIKSYFKDLSDKPNKVMSITKNKTKMLKSRWHNVLFTHMLIETIDFVFKESYPNYSIEDLDLLLAHENINLRALSQYFRLLTDRKDELNRSPGPSFT